MEPVFQLVGWAGALLVVGAYFLLSYKKIEGDSALYQSMNFFGAAGVGINAFHQAAWPSFGIQIVWAFIAIFALGNMYRHG